MVSKFSLTGGAVGEVKLPKVFSIQIRTDFIHRAFLVAQANARQPYGTDPLAGHRTAAHYHGVKDTSGSMKNREVARGPRSHGGNSMQEWKMRFVPQSVKGRASHGPVAEKIWGRKVNRKEAIAALKSAIAATASSEMVRERGHKVPEGFELPIVIEDSIESVKKTKELLKVFNSVKLSADLGRIGTKVRAGRGKMRGRMYKQGKSLLLVLSKKSPAQKAAENMPGVDVCTVSGLSVQLLAPGSKAGRLSVWSEAALKELEKRFG